MSHFTGESKDPRSRTVELSASDRHRLLTSERRRSLLYVLENRTSPLELADLAAAVVAREADEGRFGNDPERVAITLHHQHLPILADAGVLEYDPSSNRVEAVHATVERT